MEVQAIMTRDVVSVRPDTSYKAVVEELVRTGVSGVPVVDDTGALLGIVTEADLVAASAYAGRPRALAVLGDVLSARPHHWATKASGRTAAEIMTTGLVTCEATDDVRTVARRMLDRDVKRLPVLADGRLVGIVARHDILRALARPDEAIAADVEHVLRTDPNRPDDHHVVASVTDGRVVLSGDVKYAWDAPVIVAMVRAIEGVISVESHLHHREPAPEHAPLPWPWATPVS
jgi:CBS domain-containing protein